MDGKEYADDLGKSIPFDKFYKAMQDGAQTRTSQVNADEFEQYFEDFLRKEKTFFTCASLRESPVPLIPRGVAQEILAEK